MSWISDIRQDIKDDPKKKNALINLFSAPAIGMTGTYDTPGKKYGSISMQGFNPLGEMILGNYDWKKMLAGAKTGSNIGGQFGPIGRLIGSWVGGGAGGTWVGDPNESTSGLGMASQGQATGPWAAGNTPWKYINTAFAPPVSSSISALLGNQSGNTFYPDWFGR